MRSLRIAPSFQHANELRRRATPKKTTSRGKFSIFADVPALAGDYNGGRQMYLIDIRALVG
jgi:hypothetical protein